VGGRGVDCVELSHGMGDVLGYCVFIFRIEDACFVDVAVQRDLLRIENMHNLVLLVVDHSLDRQ